MNGPKGREYCNDGVGPHPFYVNVDLTNGNIANHWIDSLQAAFPGVQVLFGDLGWFFSLSMIERPDSNYKSSWEIITTVLNFGKIGTSREFLKLFQ